MLDITESFKLFRLEGDHAANALATYTLFGQHTSPRAIYEFGLAAAASMVSRSVATRPVIGVQFYLQRNESFFARATFTAACTSATFLRKTGRRTLREGQEAISLGSFYAHLYSALLYYRAAQLIFTAIQNTGREDPGSWVRWGVDEADVQRKWIETEEVHAQIAASMCNAAVPRGNVPQVMDPESFMTGVGVGTQGMGDRQQEDFVHNLVLQLVIPEWLRDLTICWLRSKRGFVDERSLKLIARVVHQNEENIRQIMCLGDPNYLLTSYGVQARLHEINGNAEKAEQAQRKASQEYISKLIESSFGRSHM